MDDGTSSYPMRKALRTLSITNLIAAVAFAISYFATMNWLYLLASVCVTASGLGIIFFSKYLQRKFYSDETTEP